MRPKLALILVRKRPKNRALTSPKGSKLVLIQDYTRLNETLRDSTRLYETGSQLGLDRSHIRYLTKTLLTFGSCLVYLVETCSLMDLVSFTLLRLYFFGVSSCLGLVRSRIISCKSILEVSPKKMLLLRSLAPTLLNYRV